MEFDKLITERYSVRNYSDKPVEKEVLEQILAAGNKAPTAKNKQPQRIYVLQSEEAIASIRKITRCAYNAPVVLVFTYKKDEEFVNPLGSGYHSGDQDVAIVATHIMLKAADLGLGTVWVNWFPTAETIEAFNIPDDERLVLIMPLGYPSINSVPAENHFKEKALEETVKYL